MWWEMWILFTKKFLVWLCIERQIIFPRRSGDDLILSGISTNNILLFFFWQNESFLSSTSCLSFWRFKLWRFVYFTGFSILVFQLCIRFLELVGGVKKGIFNLIDIVAIYLININLLKMFICVHLFSTPDIWNETNFELHVSFFFFFCFSFLLNSLFICLESNKCSHGI